MADQFAVSDAALSAAGVMLVAASHSMVSQNRAMPSGAFDSLKGIDEAVQAFLNGVVVARAALADAAKMSSAAIVDVMHSGDELDAHIARTLYSGCAVRGSAS